MALYGEFTPEGAAVIVAMTAVIGLLTYLVRRCYDRWGDRCEGGTRRRRKKPPPPDRS